ncbi:unnamed protein product, partial [Iphiclides podalirius]
MGDTTEGQVFLGDTVMLDGEQPVTLSELLETITGVEMPLSEDLPVSLCSTCSVSALSAADFRTVCRQAAHKWAAMLQLLGTLPEDGNECKALLAVMESDQMVMFEEYESVTSAESAATRLTLRLNPKEKETTANRPPTGYRCQCPDCGKKFPYVQQLYQHLKESTDLKRACYVCAKIMSRDELVSHLRTDHNRNPHDCKECPALLPSRGHYEQHMRKAHAPGACTCGDCGRSFRTSNAFRAHLSVHTAKTCPACKRPFRNQTCYLHHVRQCCELGGGKGATVVQSGGRRVKVGLRGRADKECVCDYCGKRFAGKKFVCAHIQIVHTKSTHRPCAYCGKSLAAAHMTEHVKKHETVSAFTCELCGVVLRTRLGYVQHLRLHSGERPYACRHCGETFSASSRRSEHVRKAHGPEAVPKHACDRCPARFRLPYRLKKHVASVHGTGQRDPSFECSECGERFGSCRGLLHHSRTHQRAAPARVAVQKKRQMECRVYSEPTRNSTGPDGNQLTSVEEAADFPHGVCSNCTKMALAAMHFRKVCLESAKQWARVASQLAHASAPGPRDRALFVFYDDTNIKVLRERNQVVTVALAVNRLNQRLRPSSASKAIPKVRKPRKGKRWRCQDCGKEFTLPCYLNQHLKMTMKRACTHCGAIVSREKLQQHLLRHHGQRLFRCKTCHQLFHRERELTSTTKPPTALSRTRVASSFENRRCYKYHVGRCGGPKLQPGSAYECHDCGSRYSKKESLRTHIEQKHLNVLPFVCQECGKRSSTLGHHRAHEAIHLPRRKVYQCYCGAKLLTELGFSLHSRIHSGERPYECPECGDRFLSSSRRLDHIKRRHTSLKDMPHPCKQCPATFLRPSQLKKHCLVIHGVSS